jgi:RNA polymerase sigma-70 factor (ECF subfamily)
VPGARTATVASAADLKLVARLLDGDEGAFASLVRRHHGAMVGVAAAYVGGDRAVAEEVAQDAWLGMLRQLGRFEGRSSLRTWLFRILVNTAKTRGRRERRSVPFSALPAGPEEPAVAPERFLPAGDRWAGHWASPPEDWDGLPEERLLSMETVAVVRRTIDALPDGQRAVITLRDVEGWPAAEVCALLGISEGNQRVLLHRARSRVRGALERHLEEGQDRVRA